MIRTQRAAKQRPRLAVFYERRPLSEAIAPELNSNQRMTSAAVPKAVRTTISSGVKT